MKLAVLLLLATGCVRMHTLQSAVPLDRGRGAATVQAGGWYAVDDKDKEPDENYAAARSTLFDLDGAIDYGVRDHVEVGLEAGMAGVAVRGKVGYGKRGSFAAAIAPRAFLGWGARGADVTGLLTLGPVTAAGFWGIASSKGIKCSTCVEDTNSYAVFGGGIGARFGPYLGGVEVQHWAYPSGLTIYLLQAGYVWDEPM